MPVKWCKFFRFNPNQKLYCKI